LQTWQNVSQRVTESLQDASFSLQHSLSLFGPSDVHRHTPPEQPRPDVQRCCEPELLPPPLDEEEELELDSSLLQAALLSARTAAIDTKTALVILGTPKANVVVPRVLHDLAMFAGRIEARTL
jgi:hypothetical protein